MKTRCCIVGGGPAGILLGFLLARSGIEVTVLEKHKDFFRDFRGDTIHPSTLEIMHQLGLLEKFLQVPHQEVKRLGFVINGNVYPLADFSHLPTICKFIVFMPQWDFLSFITEQAKRYPTFSLLMNTRAEDLIMDGEKVGGVKAVDVATNQALEIKADLVVTAEGRHSVLREKGRFKLEDLGAPIDVLWFHLPHHDGDPAQSLGHVGQNSLGIMLNRGDYWQCGYIIRKGSIEKVKAAGLKQFQNEFAKTVPFVSDRVQVLTDWDQIKLLTVAVNRLEKWYRPGMLCIGDAAHAMSPVGGVGINLALQDAVATANILVPILADPTQHEVPIPYLEQIQAHRTKPTRWTQAIQVFIHKHVLEKLFHSHKKSTPFAFLLIKAFPILQSLIGRLIGMGIQPEKIETLDAPKTIPL